MCEHVHSACCLVAGDSVPDVGSSSLLYYQTPLVEVPDHVVYLLCHHSIRLLPRHSQALGLHHAEVNLFYHARDTVFREALLSFHSVSDYEELVLLGCL